MRRVPRRRRGGTGSKTATLRPRRPAEVDAVVETDPPRLLPPPGRRRCGRRPASKATAPQSSGSSCATGRSPPPSYPERRPCACPSGVIAVVVAAALAAALAGTAPVHSPNGHGDLLPSATGQRLCPSPMCGGWWARRVNRDTHVCGKGLGSTECYAATLDLDALQLTDEQAREPRAGARERAPRWCGAGWATADSGGPPRRARHARGDRDLAPLRAGTSGAERSSASRTTASAVSGRRASRCTRRC